MRPPANDRMTGSPAAKWSWSEKLRCAVPTKQAVVCANASPVFPPVVQAVPKEDWPVEARSCEKRTLSGVQCLLWTSLLAGCMRVSKSVLVQSLFLLFFA